MYTVTLKDSNCVSPIGSSSLTNQLYNNCKAIASRLSQMLTLRILLLKDLFSEELIQLLIIRFMVWIILTQALPLDQPRIATTQINLRPTLSTCDNSQ